MPVPYAFSAATSAIPLSQLDANFNTTITLGNTAIQLGNTVTTLNNMTLANVTISSGNVTLTNVTVTTANVTTANITTAIIGTANVTTANVATSIVTTSETLSYGTANGVAYLNGSKVLTTGSALTFNGTNFGVGGTALEKFAVVGTTSSLNVNPDSSGTAIMYAYASSAYNPLRLDALNQQFYISGTEQMRLTSSTLSLVNNPTLTAGTANGVAYLNGSKVLTTGSALTFDGTNLGLSGTNPAFIGNSSSTAFYIDNRTTGKVITFRVSNAAQADTEAMTIASASGGIGAVGIGYTSLTSVGNNGLAVAGNVGIGTSSPTAKLEVYNGTTGELRVTNLTNGFQIYTDASATIMGTYTNAPLVFRTNATERMRLDSSGTFRVKGAGTAGSTDAVQFDGAAPASTLILNSSGNLGVGVASPNAKLDVYSSSTTAGTPIAYFSKALNSNATSNVLVQFYINFGGTGSGQINANGASAAAFGTFSDASLKENIVGLPSQLGNIMSLRPVEFDYKDGSGHQIGFVAQEMQEVYPDVVAPGKDDMLMVTGWSKTEARLVKAIQELKAEVDSLKAQLKGA